VVIYIGLNRTMMTDGIRQDQQDRQNYCRQYHTDRQDCTEDIYF
jgi:hypothetical protein